MIRILPMCLLLIGLTISPARAQTFGPPVPTEQVLVLLDREGNVRFTLAGYYTLWQNPFRVTLSAFSEQDCQTVFQKYRLIAATPASPLLEGNYLLSRRWSVGFWYNPIRGERLQQTVLIKAAKQFAALDIGRDTDLADVHLIYHASHGLTAQLGYYHESGTISSHLNGLTPGYTLLTTHYTLASWNFWLTQRLDVFTHNRLTSERLDAQLIPFVSMGYHASSGLNHAVSVMAGAAITFSDEISLSGSVWFFDLHNPATRITAGLVIQY